MINIFNGFVQEKKSERFPFLGLGGIGSLPCSSATSGSSKSVFGEHLCVFQGASPHAKFSDLSPHFGQVHVGIYIIAGKINK
jgi:hypothetical protein